MCRTPRSPLTLAHMMNQPLDRVPAQAWIVTAAGTAMNLCLGILYAWSIWKSTLVPADEQLAGQPMSGLNAGWHYLNNAQGTWAYCICGFTFALCMIPGGIIQDRFGPRLAATASGLFLGAGCVLAGLMKSYLGLILGFGILGGIGMGLGYAAATPAAVKWFGPHRRGLIVGLVVGGFGGAAIYIAPLADALITNYGLSGSLIGLGALFAGVIIVAAQFLAWPPPGYVPPGSPNRNIVNQTTSAAPTTHSKTDWTAREMLGTWQYYALFFLSFGSAQSGLLVIANAKPMLNAAAASVQFLQENAWLLASFGGILNATGRIGTGQYSDKLGRKNAYLCNGLISAVCLLATPWVMETKNPLLLFVVVGIAFWQYGGGLALTPAMTADYFGAKNMGFNYGLVFLGWGAAFFVPQLAGYLNDYGQYHLAFYLSAGLLLAAVAVSQVLRPPGGKG